MTDRTEDESESECKSYFNLYTFVIFIGKTFISVVVVAVAVAVVVDVSDVS